MDRKEYLADIQQTLIKRRDALRKALAGDVAALKEIIANDTDEDTMAVHGDISSQLVDVESKELQRVEEALERHKEGQFGVCEDCQKEIPIPRLLALPYAVRCINCQRKFEIEENSL